MTTWFTSDQHLGHEKVIGFCNRPFQDAAEMDRIIVDKWNRVVKPKDIVYVLGDVCFHRPPEGVKLLQKLCGNKILIQGNHDKYSRKQYLSAGFLEVADEMMIRFKGRKVRLSHYPYSDESEADAHDKRYLDRRPKKRVGEVLLCGHVHERWKVRDHAINVGVDVWNFYPASEMEIESLFMKMFQPHNAAEEGEKTNEDAS